MTRHFYCVGWMRRKVVHLIIRKTLMGGVGLCFVFCKYIPNKLKGGRVLAGPFALLLCM